MPRLFSPILAGANLGDRLFACLGALLGVAAAGAAGAAGIALSASVPGAAWLVAPIGASAVLVFAVPASPLAQPWPVVGGNTISAAVGLAVGHLLPVPALAGAVAVAAAILVMSLLRCLHPPGGAAALTAALGGPAVAAAGWLFPAMPVTLNSVALVAVGLAFHRWSGHSYPHRAGPIAGHPLPPLAPPLDPDDIQAALTELGEPFDIAREDLALIVRAVEARVRSRASSPS